MVVLTDEQELLKDAASAWAQERAPLSAFRKLRNEGAPLGYDPSLFRDMAAMGWTGVLVPEEFGGADFGYLSLGIVLEQLGRTLTPSPLVMSSLAAASGLRRGGTPAQQEIWLPRIASGEAVIALALDEGARHDPFGAALSATRAEGGWRLSGEKRPVLLGMSAQAAIVAARSAGVSGEAAGITLFLVPTDRPGLTRAPLREVEQRGAAIFRFDAVQIGSDAVLGTTGKGAPLLEHMLDCARVGLAAEMLGAASEAFEITLNHLRTRVQFGKLIGAFQALQHRMASLYGELELTRAATEAAFSALDGDSPETGELASLAKAMAGDTFRRVANEMIQMHGGIGMTDEHDAGLFLKRARVADATFGSAGFHRERYAALLGM